jgi:hypothetical protein|tara:strand:- start:129 stop:620 length:492 start_codon:yes stop_codon:yes gene_type:complete
MIMQNVQERLNSLPKDYLDFVASDFTESLATQIATVYQLSPASTKAIANGILYFLLLYLSKQDFINYLEQSVGMEKGNALVVATSFFDILPESFPWEVVPEDISSDIAELEKQIESLQPLRTMSEDMRTDQATDTVYSSSQEELLNRKQSTPSRPRWDTDTDQ